MRMDVLPQIVHYRLLRSICIGGGISELDEDPTVLDMGLKGDYLEAMGIDLGKKTAKPF